MAKIERDDDVLARHEDQSGESSALTAELLQQTRPPQGDSKKSGGDSNSVTVPEKDGSNRDVPLNEGESKHELATGDTLVSTFSGDVLLMADGTRVGFAMPDLTDSNVALEQLDKRLHVRGADGKDIGVRYAATLTGIPPTDVYRLSDGSEMKVTQGIAVLTMRNGAEIYMDELGIFAVKKGDKGAVVRQPEILGPLWDVQPKPEPKQSL